MNEWISWVGGRLNKLPSVIHPARGSTEIQTQNPDDLGLSPLNLYPVTASFIPRLFTEVLIPVGPCFRCWGYTSNPNRQKSSPCSRLGILLGEKRCDLRLGRCMQGLRLLDMLAVDRTSRSKSGYYCQSSLKARPNVFICLCPCAASSPAPGTLLGLRDKNGDSVGSLFTPISKNNENKNIF